MITIERASIVVVHRSAAQGGSSMSSPRLAHRVATVLAAAALLVVLAAGAWAATARANRSPNGLALTPPMGYNDWSYYQCNVDESVMLAQARALVRTGLAARGYDTVTTDDCWMARTRNAHGQLRPNRARFPHGMADLGRRLHAMGLKFGIYEDAGTHTCGGFAGSWGHYRATAEQFARWGVDYVKLDGCNIPKVHGQTMAQTYDRAYARFSRALHATGRPIVFSASAPAYFQGTPQWHHVIRATSRIANLWREGLDIPLGPSQEGEQWHGIDTNFAYNVGLGRYAGPGHWNDPDMLLVGDPLLSTTEMQSQMTLWSEMAAPLIISTNLNRASPAALRILGDRRVIAVDQDRLGVQGHIVARGRGFDVLTKPLVAGARSVVLFNSGPTGVSLATSARAVGLPHAARYTAEDLVTGARVETSGVLSSGVASHGTEMWRVHAGAPAGLPSAASVSVHWPPAVTGTPEKVGVTVRDEGSAPIAAGGAVTLQAPPWLAVTAGSALLPEIAPGQQATVHFAALPGTLPAGRVASDLVATVSYRSGHGRATAVGQTGVVTSTPYPTLAAAFNDVGVSSESRPAAGNFDGYDDSFSAQALAAAGVRPGSTVRAGGAVFSWPAAPAGQPDNVQGSGATVQVTGSGSRLAFLGSAYGASRGTVTVTYTDGTTSTDTIGFPSWCCAAKHRFGALPAIVMNHYDFFTGPEDFGTHYDIYENAVPLEPGRTVERVRLPRNRAIHVFALAVVS
jgi:alpha-galactosidase